MRTLLLVPFLMLPGLFCLADITPTAPKQPTMLERLAMVARIEKPPAAQPAVTPAPRCVDAASAQDPVKVEDVRAPEPEVKPASLPDAPVNPLIPRSAYVSRLMTDAGITRPIGDLPNGTPLGIWQRQIEGREKRRGSAAVESARIDLFRALAAEQK
ncbi:hypothetical protein [Geminisphaera colitermitum]|uniref:hypothetical protein n=1 Tax=Geminisphaera colitermitum TaxID=1148786 RepID=UPI000158D35F|nr:hypothetical protein [Geminisphaera colitermitum]